MLVGTTWLNILCTDFKSGFVALIMSPFIVVDCSVYVMLSMVAMTGSYDQLVEH